MTSRRATQNVGLWRPWIQIVLLAITGGSPLLARVPPQTSNSRPRTRGRAAGLKRHSTLTITLRIYNYARVAPAALTEAENVASVILRKAGIESAWIDCPLSEADLAGYPACQRPPTPSQFVLRLVAQPLPNYSDAHEDEIGLALPCRETEAGCSAYLSYKSVMNWAGRADTSADRILGHVMLHEIGHLLLGPGSHSETGVMRRDWDVDDLASMAQRFICFTSGQAHAVRAEVRIRSKGP